MGIDTLAEGTAVHWKVELAMVAVGVTAAEDCPEQMIWLLMG
jgi:hypothetical protein